MFYSVLQSWRETILGCFMTFSSLRSQLPPRNITRQMLLFFIVGAVVCLIVYATGGIGAGSAFGVFMVLCAGAVASYYVSRSYPADKEFRRSLADTIGFTLVRSLLFGATIYLALYFAGSFGDRSLSEETVWGLLIVCAFAGAYGGVTFFLEWFGRKAKT